MRHTFYLVINEPIPWIKIILFQEKWLSISDPNERLKYPKYCSKMIYPYLNEKQDVTVSFSLE